MTCKRLWVALALLLLMPWGSVARAQAESAPPCQPINGPAYLGGRDLAKTSVVVFVHGVLSNAIDAWSAGTDKSWPCLLRDEPAFGNSNLYLYAYDTAPLGANPSIDKVAKQLVQDLIDEKVLNHAHVSIVAHSMGGLAVSRALLLMQADVGRRALLERIKLVQFYGTPATGADIAEVASQLSASVQFEGMQPGPAQLEVVERWASIPWPFPWYCLAEGRRTGYRWLLGTLVVPRDSATALCRTRPAGVDVLEHHDHLSMVKPTSLQDTPHRALKRRFVSCVAAAIPSSAPPSEASTPDGQLMLQSLSRLRASLLDTSEEGRVAALSAVQGVLYLSTGWADAYLMPARPAAPALAERAFELLGSRPFAIEFLKLFQPHPADLSPAWVGRVGTLERYVPDGLLIELRRAWSAKGLVQDGDTVVAMTPRANGDQVFVIGGIQPTATGERQARIRGLLIVPAPPRTCD